MIKNVEIALNLLSYLNIIFWLVVLSGIVEILLGRGIKAVEFECNIAYSSIKVIMSCLLSYETKAWFPLSQLRPRQRPISSKKKAISMKDDCSTL